jgi:hypothetical protein
LVCHLRFPAAISYNVNFNFSHKINFGKITP